MSADGDIDPHRATLERLARELEIDVRAGLAVVQGRADRYLELLRRLASGHAEDMRQLAACLERNERENAIRIAHSLKGAAATLGARHLADHAKSIEMRLRQSESLPPPETLAADRERIQRELLAIAALLPAPSTGAPPPVAPDVAPDVATIIAELAARLAADDFLAAEVFRSHEAALRAALGEAAEPLARAIAGFDFKTALSLLRARRQSVA